MFHVKHFKSEILFISVVGDFGHFGYRSMTVEDLILKKVCEVPER
jgi:hypothetical protein